MPENPPDRRELSRSMAYAQVGTEMVVPMFLGLALDYYAGTKPWGVIGGTILGFVGGLIHLVTMLNQQERETRADQKQKGGQA